MAERRLAELSWRLLEYKAMYYAPERVHGSWHEHLTVPDGLYDRLERRYLALCREAGRRNTLVHKVHPDFEDVPGDGMMEIDEGRPSVRLVLRKLAERRRVPEWEL